MLSGMSHPQRATASAGTLTRKAQQNTPNASCRSFSFFASLSRMAQSIHQLSACWAISLNFGRRGTRSTASVYGRQACAAWGFTSAAVCTITTPWSKRAVAPRWFVWSWPPCRACAFAAIATAKAVWQAQGNILRRLPASRLSHPRGLALPSLPSGLLAIREARRPICSSIRHGHICGLAIGTRCHQGCLAVAWSYHQSGCPSGRHSRAHKDTLVHLSKTILCWCLRCRWSCRWELCWGRVLWCWRCRWRWRGRGGLCLCRCIDLAFWESVQSSRPSPPSPSKTKTMSLAALATARTFSVVVRALWLSASRLSRMFVPCSTMPSNSSTSS